MNDAALTCDAFLGGRLQIWQPARGYRAGVDPVLLGAAVPATGGARVLDLGCGVGTAALCLGARVSGLDLTGVELQQDYADLARQNAAENDIALQVVKADVRALPATVAGMVYDHVLTNPPYFDRTHGTAAADQGRETALGEAMSLSRWLDIALRRVKPGGTLTMVQRMERLPEALTAVSGRIGACQVLPVAARAGQPAGLFLLHGIKGRRTPFRLCAPMVLHEGPAHPGDREHYTPEANGVLRNVAPLPHFPIS
ncbi:tRNA1(Val) (adenine(37)-N6)-methyltransferase [Meridianimarinicoccus sp. RP-17]|uniref:tRNA1(Val) (adenine(37)-N6)-methyltransferase n=1 Tax=Meridianimarinicoccus zhengii TaxID=2056810 RepID=UPI000DAB7247|nr:methyltransferase [Phycocomes zhengii]